MKKITITLPLCLSLLSLAACGQNSPTDDLVQEITLDVGSSADADGVGKETADTLSSESSAETGNVYAFSYAGETLIPGDTFDPSVLPEYSSVSTVPSCAVEGMDNVYNYESFELTAFDDEEGERIFSIYFIDPNLTTPEGLSLGQTINDMVSLYGTDYETDGSAYTYTRGNTFFIVVAQGESIISIEYRFNVGLM